MSRRLRFTPLAEADPEGIGDYIAQDNPRRALSFLQELREHCHRIARAPSAYQARPELAEDLRSCSHGHDVILFQPREQDVLIVRILHGARDIQTQFRE